MMKRKGFTLIELLIVVTIIGILAVALVPRIIGGSAAARDARRQTDLQTVATGLEYYLSENGDFSGMGAIADAGDDVCASALSSFLSGAIGSMPSDPQDSNANSAFGTDCSGDYAVLFMQESATNSTVTKYAVAARLELPEEGDDFVYGNTDSTETIYTTYAPTAYAAADANGYFVVY
ncbi:hypothetical protein A2344_01580 [Candidatus Peregrinibacteria bacterium RIFOXYB12_FULL_41_12]|nr:MAG: hypothetical protein A2244_04355 [Candidatus Peregrinibacteria bacterium RIFOXYA2_FULL_41_18]OGJ48800.1 MAG: hypothetical protein A2344_01580 [Candidatus Peregrinibacteria bacterium RIFOXYB12_FULL_41_12]